MHNSFDSSELRRRMDTLRQRNIEEYDTDDSDLIREYNRLLQSSEEEERPVERRLFSSDSSSSDSSNNMDIHVCIYIYTGKPPPGSRNQ